ncbi:thiol-specific monooxygenase [Monosporozyma servazzii]
MPAGKLQKLAIIGGGPGGLASARVFLANCPSIEHIDLFVNDDNIGGVWYVPERSDVNKERSMYEYLETNLPKELMQFSDFPFKDEVNKFPKKQDVFNYLQDYYAHFIKDNKKISIHWNAEVVNVSKTGDSWTITADIENHIDQFVNQYDHIISATGHFNRPFIPNDVKGLGAWFENGAAIHSKDFNNSEFTRGKTVVIVGNGSSGQDLVNQVSSVAKHVYHSISDTTQRSPIYIDDPIISTVPQIVNTNWDTRTVQLANGVMLKDVDILIYATGYLYDVSFFDKEVRQDIVGDVSGIGKSMMNLFSHIFWNKDPTLAFSLVPLGIVPFPTAELQAALIVKVFSGKLDISNMKDTEYSQSVQFGAGVDVEYYRSLQNFIDDANVGGVDPFQPVKWCEPHKDLRLQCPDLKQQRNVHLHNLATKFRAQNQSYRI